jgi:glucan phosphoethanolaminetransferase (alkaline phosphatase superfamily)
MVLLFLYGNSIIGVDMFLNVVTTSSNEAGELLHNLLPALFTVFILYVSPLIWSAVRFFRKNKLRVVNQKRFRKYGAITALTGVATMILSYICVPGFALTKDIFPANVVKNLVLACDRVRQNIHYPETSKGFTFGAKSTHQGVKELYVVVIGETSRADSYSLLGYGRKTNPLLAANANVVTFRHVMSESNTTHKSVPMLLSLVDAENYKTINSQKSIITAFKEAGYYTAFISTQPLNHSYTDYFGNEADYVKFLNADNESSVFQKDDALVKQLDHILATSDKDKQIVFLHSYGSHFSYSDRYERSFSHFKPDTIKDAAYSNRDELVNAYDNAIRYTDFLLDSIIRRLESKSGYTTAMMYVPDHGEDLFDDSRKRFLHSSPTPTYWQLHVPIILWMSDSYKASYPNHWENAKRRVDSQISSSRSFAPTVLEMAGIITDKVQQGSSIVGENYIVPTRYYVSDRNECLPLMKSGMTKIDSQLMRLHGIK